MPLLEDGRIPGRHAYVLSDGNRLVKVPDEIRQCVAFVCYEAMDGLHLGGTAFFMAELIKDTTLTVNWIVTAAHVINGVASKSTDGIVRLRVNRRDRGTDWVIAHESKWTRHPTDDIAVISLPLDATVFDYRTFPVDEGSMATADTIVTEGIGVGDDLFLTGLFVHHPGLERNIPIVRVGNIAAMPGEPIRTRYWGTMRAFLVEARSIGGLSGSPVFVHEGIWKKKDGKLVSTTNDYGIFRLLGVMSGHYPGELVEADVHEDDEKEVNMGIAIVVPVDRVLETMRLEVFEMAKAKERQEWLDKQGAVADTSDAPLSTSDETPSFESRDEFEKALQKVSRRKPSEPDEGTSET